MKHSSKYIIVLFLLVLVATAGTGHATELTFDIFTDSNKTSRLPNGTFLPQAYGDNVSDFNPDFYTYGPTGGPTPHITVDYRFLSVVNPTSANPNVNGESNGLIYDNGYGDLQYVVYDVYGATPPDTWYQEIRFNSTIQYAVTLSNFQIAAWNPNAPVGGQTLKIVQDANSPSAITLWSAGPDFGVTVNGGAGVHDTYTPNVTVADGHTLSLIYGLSSLIAVDNIVFSESVPEPSGMTLTGLAGAALLLWRRGHSSKL